jgi:hypothetical protein
VPIERRRRGRKRKSWGFYSLIVELKWYNLEFDLFEESEEEKNLSFHGIGNKLLSGSGMENRWAYFGWEKKRRWDNSEADSTSKLENKIRFFSFIYFSVIVATKWNESF